MSWLALVAARFFSAWRRRASSVVHLRRAGPVQLADQPADVPHQVDVRAVPEAKGPGVHLAAQARAGQHLAQRRGVDDLEQLALRQLGEVNRHRFRPAACSATPRSAPG